MRPVPVAELTAAEGAAAMTACFEGYVAPVTMTPERFERRFRAEHLDPFASVVYRDGASDAALCLVTRRGWASRIGAMAVAPAYRGSGLAGRLLGEQLAAARDRGDHTVTLEVIAGNERAERLYERHGFGRVRRLVGWRWTPGSADRVGAPPPPDDPPELVECDPAEVAAAVRAYGADGLPWMLAAPTYAAATKPAVGYRLGDIGWALVDDPVAEVRSVGCLLVRPDARGRGHGRRLLHALTATAPERAWSVTPVVPEGLADRVFAAAGWEPHPISQWEMVYRPDAPPA